MPSHYFETGAPLLNAILGGGLPTGVTEIYGPDSVGKTSLALDVGRESFYQNNPVLFINMENTAGPDFIRATIPNCLYTKPLCGEAAIDAAYAAIRSGVKVIIIDSSDAMIPRIELFSLVGEREYSAQARLLFHGMDVLREEAKRYGCCVIVTSQIRYNLAVGNKKLQSSFAKVFRNIADCRLKLSKVRSKSEYGATKYTVINVEVKKLIHAPPLRSENIYLWTGKGFDRNYELLRALEQAGIAVRGGAYFKVKGFTLGPGYDEATKQIQQHYNRLKDEINHG